MNASGSLRLTGCPMAAPTLGQHTREVLAEYLKMPEEEIETMLKEQKELVHT